MNYYHFLIDLSHSNENFQEQQIFRRLIDQIDFLIELNQDNETKDIVGFTFFAQGILRRELEFPLSEFRALVCGLLTYHPGSSILDAIAKTSSYIEENFAVNSRKKNLLIFSDFAENSSSYYSVETLGELIETFSNRHSWEFYAFGIKKSQISLFLRMNFNLENLILLPS